MSTGELAAARGGAIVAPSVTQRVAVLIPCLDEALTVAKVIEDFRRALPAAAIYVIDNGSTDGTADIAAANGAQVIRETRRGKGFAVRAGFRRIDADLYVMVDGDDTYPAESVGALLEPALAGPTWSLAHAGWSAPRVSSGPSTGWETGSSWRSCGSCYGRRCRTSRHS